MKADSPIHIKSLSFSIYLTRWLKFALVCLLAGRAWATPVIEVAAFEVTPVHVARSLNGSGYQSESGAQAQTTRVTRNDAWAQVLRRLLVGAVDLPRLLPLLAGVDLPELVPGRFIRFKEHKREALFVLDYLQDLQQAWRIEIGPDSLAVVQRLPDDELVMAARRDEMKSSLFSATDAVGLPEDIAIQLTDIFAEEVDFLRDLDQGYRCALVYEMNYQYGLPRPGRILAAELRHANSMVSAFYFDVASGESGYFDPSGMDVNRTLSPVTTLTAGAPAQGRVINAMASFRRSPLEFSRITSAPAKLRYHPILKEWRAHRGTDYGAPIGTKVKATADGKVVFAGSKGGYGNLLILRHYDRFSTYYGHLDKFAPSLNIGDRIRKGELVGYVGMTGLATGPHLHYELRDDAAPGALDIPLVVRTVPNNLVNVFQEQMAKLRQQLDYAYRANLVVLD